ncbi:MAG: acetylxylan esterase [Stackebrandtia sp.]
MPVFDLSLEDLREYRPDVDEPADFDAFWERSLGEAAEHPLNPTLTPHRSALSLMDVHDVVFAGWAGDPIRAWLIAPKTDEPVGCLVRHLGYNNGRGFPHENTAWPAAGWATLVVDTRGQGAFSTASPGDTGDPHGADHAQTPGMMTRGILDPQTYYYRRAVVDAVRAVDVAASLERVDAGRVVVSGSSQGGGLAQAAAALNPKVAAALIDVPFLCHFRRAAEISSTGPYPEIVAFLASQRDREDAVFRTLSYFDGVNFAARGRVPALYSTALLDTTCPPSTVFAAHNRWGGPKEITVWPWNKHEGGHGRQFDDQAAFLARHVAG